MLCCLHGKEADVRREPFHYVLDQLSRSDARADSTVSIDVSSNGTVPPDKLTYPHHYCEHPATEHTDQDPASGFDVKQVFTPGILLY